MRKRYSLALIVVLLVTLVIGAGFANQSKATAQDEFVFGMILVGPHDDNGWSEAHYNGGLYVEEHVEGAKMIWIDKVNPADSPELTMDLVVEDLVSQGAKLIIATSDDFKADFTAVAPNYPDIVFLHVSGDGVWTGEASENMGNLFGQMQYGKAIAGCAAALKTETGKIAYLGPLINNETRLFANAVYLGAKYCYEHYRGMDPATLQFTVNWIGFWFSIPGVTLDPTEVANAFFNDGNDVVLSGIDTTEATVVAGQRSAEGERVFSVGYDYIDTCAEAPSVCLGVPYYNWGPAYVTTVNAVKDGTWTQSFDWLEPDWSDINNPDTSIVGFAKGTALTEEEAAILDEYTAALGAGAKGEEGGVVLFQGPLNYQDGSTYLEDGEVATPEKVWYMPQLLEGMIGESSAESE